MGEWLKPTDCKSVPPSEVRRFESSPVHQRLAFVRECRRLSGSEAAALSAVEGPQPKSRALVARDLMRISRFAMALAAYVVLAVLALTTISDAKLRMATLAVLALFAVKTIVRRKDVLHGGEDKQ